MNGGMFGKALEIGEREVVTHHDTRIKGVIWEARDKNDGLVYFVEGVCGIPVRVTPHHNEAGVYVIVDSHEHGTKKYNL